jgi:ribosomal protein S17
MFFSERERIMVYRTLPFFVVALALALLVGAPLRADEKKADVDKASDRADMHEGTVVSVTADKLVMKGKTKDGEEAVEHTHTLADNAKVTCDGKECKLEDLKPRQKVRVTTKKGDKTVAIKVEALDKNEKFEKSDGKDADKDPR